MGMARKFAGGVKREFFLCFLAPLSENLKGHYNGYNAENLAGKLQCYRNSSVNFAISAGL